MKYLIIALFSFTTILSVAQEQVRLNQGTRLTVILDENLNSGISQQGDMVNLIASQDLYIDDVLVIKKGAPASGQITKASKSKMLGKKGKLDFSVDYIKTVDGRNVRLRSSIQKKGKGAMGGVIAAAAIINPLALLIKGKNITIHKGEEFTVYIDENVSIDFSDNRISSK